MSITFENGKQESMLPIFGWDTDEEGYVVDGETRIRDTRGEIIKPENIGGFVSRYGDVVPLRDNFCDIVDEIEYDQRKEDYICDWE